jgi:hypothetical protein
MNRQTQIANRQEYFKKIGMPVDRVVTADLVHGAQVRLVKERDGGTMVADTDALLTNSRNLFLSATGADCFVVYLYDPIKTAIGLAHVGWRGLLAGVVKNTVTGLITDFGSSASDILVGIGPGIRVCHFVISPADRDHYSQYEQFITDQTGKVLVDLAGIIKFQLQEMGITSSNITDSEQCTYCAEAEYFSYRRDKPTEVQAMVAYLGLKG